MWHVSRRSCYHYVNCIEKASFIISFDYICVITFIEERMQVLTTTYSMEDYKSIARAMFPFFYNNEKLWRILPHLGDTLRWGSPQELFDHLLTQADDDYRVSLQGLIGWIV